MKGLACRTCEDFQCSLPQPSSVNCFLIMSPHGESNSRDPRFAFFFLHGSYLKISFQICKRALNRCVYASGRLGGDSLFPLLKGVLQEVSLSQGASGQSFLRKVAIPPSSEMESCHQVPGLRIMGTLFC